MVTKVISLHGAWDFWFGLFDKKNSCRHIAIIGALLPEKFVTPDNKFVWLQNSRYSLLNQSCLLMCLLSYWQAPLDLAIERQYVLPLPEMDLKQEASNPYVKHIISFEYAYNWANGLFWLTSLEIGNQFESWSQIIVDSYHLVISFSTRNSLATYYSKVISACRKTYEGKRHWKIPCYLNFPVFPFSAVDRIIF